LRTTFDAQDGEPRQVIHGAPLDRLRIDDCSATAAAEREDLARREAEREARASFDLQSGPLWRARLLQFRETEAVLLLCFHHIVTDGWSTGLFFRDLGACYRAALEGGSPALPELPIQYGDFALWQRDTQSAAALVAQTDNWT